MLYLTAQILFLGLVILGLHALESRLGLALIFVFVASIQFVQNLFATTVYVQLAGGYEVSPGSAVLFSSSLFAVLLVYLKEDIAMTRGLIYGVLLANLTLAVVAKTTQWAVTAGYVAEYGDAPISWLDSFGVGVFALGTALLVVDAFLLIVVYEALRSRWTWIPTWGRIVLSLWFVLVFDTVLFVGLRLRGDPAMVDTLIGDLIGKSMAGVLYGGLLAAYLGWSRDTRSQARSREIRDPFSILTLGERYRQMQVEMDHLEHLRRHDRQRAEIALRGARLGAWDWRVQTGETFFDRRWMQMLGFTKEWVEPVIESWQSRIHPEDRERVLEVLNAHLEGRNRYYEVEHRLRTRTGEWKWILSMGRVLDREADGTPTRMTGIHMDIDERKTAEERLRRTSERLRRLSARLDDIREEERKSVAREIHDELGQALTGLQLELSWMGDRLAGDGGELRQRIESMSTIVDESLDAVKHLCARLRPPVLDDLGLGEAVRWQAREFADRYGIECVVDVSGDRAESIGGQSEAATSLFRILQETLTNTVRHAEARRVEISLAEVGGHMELTVSDDGKGIDPSALPGKESFGLLGMRERAERLGGSLEISRPRSGGTRIRARVPL